MHFLEWQDRRWTPTNPRPPRSINPNMINHLPQQSPLIFKVIYVVCTLSKKKFRIRIISHVKVQETVKSQRCQQPLVCWHRSVGFPILPIHIANLSRLSKCNLPIISIPKPLKLSNSQISYPIWQIYVHPWCLRDKWAIIRYSYVPMHFWTVMGDDMQ